MAADRFSINKSWDQVQNKFVGTGHSDMSKFEWASNQHRDTIASHIGRFNVYAAVEAIIVQHEFSFIYLYIVAHMCVGNDGTTSSERQSVCL